MAKLGVTVQKAGSSFLEQTINVTSGKLENDILQAAGCWKNSLKSNLQKFATFSESTHLQIAIECHPNPMSRFSS